MNAVTPPRDRTEGPPVLRWFIYLIFCVLVTLIAPHTADPSDKYHLPHVVTFQKVGDSMVPTSGEIWIDGRSAAKLNNNHWLYLGLAVIAIELLVLIVSRLVSHKRS